MKKTVKLLIATALFAALLAGCGAKTQNEIHVISREDGSGTRSAFVELFGIEQKDESGNKKDMTTVEAIVANKTDVMITTVAEDPNAIGYISLGSLGSTIKPLKIDGAEASAENVLNGSYKVFRPFYIATKGEIKPQAQDFIDFILSKEGQEIVSASYVAVDSAPAPYSPQKDVSGKIVVAGSSSVTPVMEKLAEAYKAVNGDVSIEIQMSDSSSGATAAIDGTCDIGMISRELKDSEKTSLTGTQIALDGIAVIVNKENPIEGATTEDIKQIYTGEVATWDKVGK